MRQLRPALKGKTSSWQNVTAIVPQGFVSKPILFLISVDDLHNGMTPLCKTFADKILLFKSRDVAAPILDTDKSL